MHLSAIFIDCRGRRPRRPEVALATAALSSVAQKRDLQKPSPVGEGGLPRRLAEGKTDEVLVT